MPKVSVVACLLSLTNYTYGLKTETENGSYARYVYYGMVAGFSQVCPGWKRKTKKGYQVCSISLRRQWLVSFTNFIQCGYQILSPRSYRLIVTIIPQGHPGSSGALWDDPMNSCWPPRVRLSHTTIQPPPRCVSTPPIWERDQPAMGLPFHPNAKLLPSISIWYCMRNLSMAWLLALT